MATISDTQISQNNNNTHIIATCKHSLLTMLIPHNTPTLTFMHSHNYSHNTISLALPSTLTLMANLIPNTLTYSPHMTTPSPIATHYLVVLQVDLGTTIEQHLRYLQVSFSGCQYQSCPFILHTKQTSAHHSVRACHVIARVNCEAIGSFSFGPQRTETPNPTRTRTYL